MKRLLDILPALAALTLMAASCSSDEEVPVAPGGECELVITLDPASAGQGTHPVRPASDEPWGSEYPEEEGTPDENRIASAQLYLITPSGTIITLRPGGSESLTGQYIYTTPVDLNATYVSRRTDGTYTISGRIVAVANPQEGTPPNPFSLPPFDARTLFSGNLMPMWGVATIIDLPLKAEHTSDAGTIYMLRTFPKITIELSDGLTDDYVITKVTSADRGWNPSALCQPTGAESAADTRQLMREGCFNPYTGSATAPAPAFFGLGTAKVWAYPAERHCAVANGKPVAFDVTIERKDGSGVPFGGQVYLCDYADGKPQFATAFDGLVRNHDYQYKISLSELQFIISCRKWILGGKVHLELE